MYAHIVLDLWDAEEEILGSFEQAIIQNGDIKAAHISVHAVNTEHLSSVDNIKVRSSCMKRRNVNLELQNYHLSKN